MKKEIRIDGLDIDFGSIDGNFSYVYDDSDVILTIPFSRIVFIRTKKTPTGGVPPYIHVHLDDNSSYCIDDKDDIERFFSEYNDYGRRTV